jgi:FkbM family methyltransferase
MILNLKTLIEEHSCEIDGVLHVGAHYGQELPLYRELNLSPIVLIEAVPEICEELLKNVRPGERVIQVAVGNKDLVDMEMYVDEANQGGSSSILKPVLHLSQYSHITFPKKRTVTVWKIDSLNLPQCNFLNIDIQGYELEALKGATEYLKGVDFIMVGVNRDEVYENCARVEELDEFLSSFERVATDWAGGAWGDAFYIRRLPF